ncbi:hypothetical protein GGS26DRAFT_323491 [Hypomontagnella submonticulosa]|nr:hypothetical protein GGS26DRAFT_323491 [Hypomontagnella submonticulosa]
MYESDIKILSSPGIPRQSSPHCSEQSFVQSKRVRTRESISTSSTVPLQIVERVETNALHTPLESRHPPNSESNPLDSCTFASSLAQSIVDCDLPSKPPESLPNRIYDWLGHTAPSRSPNQAPSEPDINSIGSLDSVNMLPSGHVSLTSASNRVSDGDYLGITLRGAGVWFFEDLMPEDKVVPDYVQAYIDRMLTDFNGTYPLDEWEPLYDSFCVKRTSNPSISESTGSSALFTHLGLNPVIRNGDGLTKSSSRTSWTKENRLTNLKLPNSLPLSTPVPDVTFGHTSTAFPQFVHGGPATTIMRQCHVGRKDQTYFPYFNAEVKAPSNNIMTGLNQCINGGAMACGILRNLLGTYDRAKRERIVVFSALLDSYDICFYITWAVADNPDVVFVTKEFDSYRMKNVHEFIRCRKIINNIHVWALQEQMPTLRGYLSEYDEQVRHSDGVISEEDLVARSGDMSGTAAGYMAAALQAAQHASTTASTVGASTSVMATHAGPQAGMSASVAATRAGPQADTSTIRAT